MLCFEYSYYVGRDWPFAEWRDFCRSAPPGDPLSISYPFPIYHSTPSNPSDALSLLYYPLRLVRPRLTDQLKSTWTKERKLNFDLSAAGRKSDQEADSILKVDPETGEPQDTLLKALVQIKGLSHLELTVRGGMPQWGRDMLKDFLERRMLK